MSKKPVILAFILLLASLTAASAECNTAPTDSDENVNGLEIISIDPLANASDAEGHMLTVTITSTTCPGQVTTDFQLITIDPQPRLTSDCIVRYQVVDELDATNSSVANVKMITAIFSDGFESGSTVNWN